MTRTDKRFYTFGKRSKNTASVSGLESVSDYRYRMSVLYIWQLSLRTQRCNKRDANKEKLPMGSCNYVMKQPLDWATHKEIL